jgi:SAM-dependent methyltransferase
MTAIADEVSRFAAALPDATQVLDVGCGLKPYAPLFAHTAYVGIDVQSSGRTDHEKTPDRWFDGLTIPYEDGEFGAVICNQVLEHAVDPFTLIGEMHRVLAPGGRLLITVPFMWGEHETPFDFRRFSSFGIKAAVESAGFSVVEHKKLVTGVDAIGMLVGSEIVAYGDRTPEVTRVQRALQWLAGYWWAVQLRLWRRAYSFDRIFVDNAVIAVKS